ncbi:M56 family metallopeptidase [Pedobacter nutrimenti]|uniref:M56 family metallopeptidase n=1 Tax=Pedobacter nutrimenti TaxID=1241337 RepID=UPI0029305185|nr:M56 family metallopeptidase [Pedobacter nutrimenti]
MNSLYYLLEANVYLVLFYAFYLLLLKKETFYTLNRYYLLSSSLISFVLPLLQISHLHQWISGQENLPITHIPTPENNTSYYWDGFSQLLILTYLIAVSLLSLQLLIKLIALARLALSSKKQHYNELIYIELKNSDAAFSFFNLLFMHPSAPNKEIIVEHEMVHIRQRHSLDILLFELIQILCWFNPVAWFLKKEIKLIHEYIADDLTTRFAIQKHDYALFLIQNSFGNPVNQLTNQIFNPSILKRRITMLDKEKSGFRSRFKFLLALPIAGGMLCCSTLAFSKEYALIDLSPQKPAVQQQDSTKKSTHHKQVQPPPPPKDAVAKPNKRKATPDQVKFPPPIIKQVKFPPPIIKPNHPTTGRHKKNSGHDQIKFPPPIIKKDQPAPPPPPVPVPPTKENNP